MQFHLKYVPIIKISKKISKTKYELLSLRGYDYFVNRKSGLIYKIFTLVNKIVVISYLCNLASS